MSSNDFALRFGLQPALERILGEPLRGFDANGVLGHVGLDIPPDLLLAAPGGGAVHLPWRLDRATPRADAWLESSFPPWARSILEDWATGVFDGFSDVVFTRGEDVSQRLYYYVCELQRRGRIAGPKAWVFDIARIDRPSSHRHTEAALGQLMQQLGITPAMLKGGIKRANDMRTAFSTFAAEQQVRGSTRERLMRASLFADITPLMVPWSEEDCHGARGRVLLAGSSPPDERIHCCIEAAGWQVSAEEYDRNLGRLGGTVVTGETEPVSAVAAQWLRHRFLARDIGNPGRRLLDKLHTARADAAILWFARDDEALAWQVPRLRQALQQQGTPALVLTARDWAFGDGASQEITTFLDGLNA